MSGVKISYLASTVIVSFINKNKCLLKIFICKKQFFITNDPKNRKRNKQKNSKLIGKMIIKSCCSTI